MHMVYLKNKVCLLAPFTMHFIHSSSNVINMKVALFNSFIFMPSSCTGFNEFGLDE
jgi:hypothetical protein